MRRLGLTGRTETKKDHSVRYSTALGPRTAADKPGIASVHVPRTIEAGGVPRSV